MEKSSYQWYRVFFQHKRDPKTKFAAKYYRSIDYFCRFVFNFKKWIEKKSFNSNANTETGPWFWFQILKPCFGHILQ